MTADTTTAPDLLPCPFCGSGLTVSIHNASFSGVELLYWHGGYFVNCGTCGAEGARHEEDCDAIIAWNRRAPVAQDAEPVAWPSGFFELSGDARLRECATDGCYQRCSIRMERGDVASEYCEPCARKIATPQPSDEAATLRAQLAEAQSDRQSLAEAICGGEDAPGLLAATSTVALVQIARDAHAAHMADIDRILKLEAALAAAEDHADVLAAQLDHMGDGSWNDACDAALAAHQARRATQ